MINMGVINIIINAKKNLFVISYFIYPIVLNIPTKVS